MWCVGYITRRCFCDCCFFFFKQKTAYEMRISDWSSDVCSSDLRHASARQQRDHLHHAGQDETAEEEDVGQAQVAVFVVRQVPAQGVRSEERRVGKVCGSRVDLGGRRCIKRELTYEMKSVIDKS